MHGRLSRMTVARPSEGNLSKLKWFGERSWNVLVLLSPALQAFFFSGLYLAVAAFMIRHAVCDWIDFGQGEVTDESKGIA